MGPLRMWLHVGASAFVILKTGVCSHPAIVKRAYTYSLKSCKVSCSETKNSFLFISFVSISRLIEKLVLI